MSKATTTADSPEGRPPAQVPPPSAQCVQGELKIWILLDEMVRFEGTADQLRAEGLIPAGLEWPKGKDDAEWTAGGFSYWLCRTRPEGHKGPMSSWLELDNWMIRIRVIGRGYRWQAWRSLERQAKDLQEAKRRLLPEGARAEMLLYRRVCAMTGDRAFQRFKARAGLIPPPRARKPRQAAA